MASKRAGEPISIHTTRVVGKSEYLVSNNGDLVSIDFVMKAFGSPAMEWATSLDRDSTRLMLSKSTILALYQVRESSDQETHRAIGSNELEQIGMARFITDHTTFAWLTDVYVVPAYQGMGLGKWLVECCKEFVDQIPALRRAMLLTSHPEQNASFYEKYLGMSAQVQDPGRQLVMTTRPGQKNIPPNSSE